METTNGAVIIACPNGCLGMISAQRETRGNRDRYKYTCHTCGKTWHGNWQEMYVSLINGVALTTEIRDNVQI